MGKDKVKLLLNLVAGAITALPRGGEIDVAVAGTPQAPQIDLRCKGTSARPPQHLADFLTGATPPIDAMNIQAYYTCRLAGSAGLKLEIIKEGGDVILRARPV